MDWEFKRGLRYFLRFSEPYEIEDLETFTKYTQLSKLAKLEKAKANEYFLDNWNIGDEQLTNALLNRSKDSNVNLYHTAHRFHEKLENLPHHEYRPYGKALAEENSIFCEADFIPMDSVCPRRQKVFNPEKLTPAQFELFVEMVKGIRVGLETYLCLNAPEAMLVSDQQAQAKNKQPSISEEELIGDPEENLLWLETQESKKR